MLSHSPLPADRRRRWGRRVFLCLPALLMAAAAWLVLAGLRDDLAPCDCALVPGNTVDPGGQPSPRLRARLERALELYRAGLFPRMVVSGGVGVEGFDEAAVMAGYLAAHGVPRESILTDAQGLNTWESARQLSRLLPPGSPRRVMVITQYFHVPRSRLALRRFGFAEVHSAHAHFFEGRDLYSIPRELVGYLKYLGRRSEV